MAEILGVASAVAGLVALAGTTSKLFYQFFQSIHNAPSIARDLASALYSLNICLGQVQELLLNPDFVREKNDQDVVALEECLVRCSELFNGIEARVRASEFSGTEQNLAKKAWESVKWSFNDEEMVDHLRRVEAAKSTLNIVVDSFTARLVAGISGEIRKLQSLARKTDRRLKDIHIFCEFLANKMVPGGTVAEDRQIEYAGFTASQAYSPGDLRSLLQSPGSVLSLQFGEMQDDSSSVIWTPDSFSFAPPRKLQSTFSLERPTVESLLQQRVNTPTAVDIGKSRPTSSPLDALSHVYASIEKQRAGRSRSRLTKFTSAMLDMYTPVLQMFSIPTPWTLPTWTFYRDLVLAAKNSNSEILADLEDIADIAAEVEIVSRAAHDHRVELQPLTDQVSDATMNYLKFVSELLGASGSKRTTLSLSGDGTRQTLKKNVERATARLKSRFQLLATARLLELGEETGGAVAAQQAVVRHVARETSPVPAHSVEGPAVDASAVAPAASGEALDELGIRSPVPDQSVEDPAVDASAVAPAGSGEVSDESPVMLTEALSPAEADSPPA